MSQRFASPLFARLLSLFGILVLLPPFLSTCTWFLRQAGLRFFVHVSPPAAPNQSLMAAWTVAGPVFACMLLALSFTVQQEQGVAALSRRWRHSSLIVAGILLLPIALALSIHAMLST